MFGSPYTRNFSPATSQTTTGMSSYLPSMSPGLDQQQIMWPVNGQNDEFMTARGGKLPDFQRFTAATNFVNQVKNSHYNSSFCVQVKSFESFKNLFISTRKIFSNFSPTGTHTQLHQHLPTVTTTNLFHHFPYRLLLNLLVDVHLNNIFQHHSRFQPVSTFFE